MNMDWWVLQVEVTVNPIEQVTFSSTTLYALVPFLSLPLVLKDSLQIAKTPNRYDWHITIILYQEDQEALLPLFGCPPLPTAKNLIALQFIDTSIRIIIKGGR